MIVFDPNEKLTTRWNRWYNYIETGKARLVLSEYKALLASNRPPTFGDAKIREEALLKVRGMIGSIDTYNVLEFRRSK